jgi:hypothetical protein
MDPYKQKQIIGNQVSREVGINDSVIGTEGKWLFFHNVRGI